MTEDSKRLEYWNFLISEKNQPRPKGITVQRLAVIKAALINRADVWERVIEHYNAASLSAAEFYESGISTASSSRAAFWEAVRATIVRDENRQPRSHESPMIRAYENTPDSNTRKTRSENNLRNHPGKNRRAQSKR